MTATIDPVSSSVAEGATLAPNSPEALQNRFLTLLLTQLQNQDPTNPMKNEEITSQMAQLSTVSGISQMNKTMENLLGSLYSSQSMQAANLIGKNVVVPGDSITLKEGKGEFGVLLGAPAATVEIAITNAAGVVVNTIKLTNMPGGISAIPWDGKTVTGEDAPDGEYKFTAVARNADAAVEAMPLSVGVVESVSTGVPGAQGAVLNIPTIGPVNFANILQILGKNS